MEVTATFLAVSLLTNLLPESAAIAPPTKGITVFFETSPNGSIYFYIEHGVDYLDEGYNDWEQAEYEDVLYKTIFDENGSFEKSEFYSFLKENGTKFPDEDRLRLREYYTLITNEINKDLDSYFNLGNLVN